MLWRCRHTGEDCVSDAQIETLQHMHAPTKLGFALAHGWTEFPGYGAGRESQGGWLNINPQPSQATQPALGQPGATVAYGIIKDPAFNLVNFSIEGFRDRIIASSAIIDSTNPDLTRFFQRGGRLIVKAQSSDYSSNPQTAKQYYERLVERFGQAVVDRHVRFYILPGDDHSGNVRGLPARTPEPQYVDLIRMSTDWVEKNTTPPDAPVLSAKQSLPPYAVSATRPLPGLPTLRLGRAEVGRQLPLHCRLMSARMGSAATAAIVPPCAGCRTRTMFRIRW
jgi:hypothetical protein